MESRPVKQQAHRERRPSGALEADVLAVIWAAGEPMTAGQVHDALGQGLAYKTVLTVLGRLHAKGLLGRELAGRAHQYWPRRGPAELAAQQMDAALRRGPQHTQVLQHFVGGLDAGEQEVLRAVLEARDRPPGGQD